MVITTLARVSLAIALGASALAAQDFVLRPCDAIKVLVPREKDLTGRFVVDPTSAVTLPVIGRFEVGGKPWPELNATILEAYRRQIREPGITLIPMRRVVVLGAVIKPGTYLVEPTARLAGAVAAASGAVADGTTHRIRIVRADTSFRADAPRHREIADIPVESGDEIFVLQRNWFARNSTFLITAMLSLTGIVVTLVRR